MQGDNEVVLTHKLQAEVVYPLKQVKRPNEIKEAHITKSYDTPMTREAVARLIQKMIIRHRETALPIKSMKHWLDLNNFGSYSDNKWVRAITDTLFRKMGGTWERINQRFSVEELTDMVMNFWQNKFNIRENYIMPSLYEYNEEKDEDDDEPFPGFEDDEDDSVYVPSAPVEAEHKYWSDKGDYSKEYDYYWKKLVPSNGHAETLQGELLRCMSSIVYDRYNNGFGNNRKPPSLLLYKYREKFMPYMKNPDDFLNFFKLYKDINFGYNTYVQKNWRGDKYIDEIVDGIVRYIMHTKLEPFPKEDKFFPDED